MGRSKFDLIFILGLSCSNFGIFVSTQNIHSVIQPFLTLSELEYEQLSKELAPRFGLPTYNQLNQSTLTSLAARLSSITSTSTTTSPPLIGLPMFLDNLEKATQSPGLCGLCQLVVALFQFDDKYSPIIIQAICDIYMDLSTMSVSNFCSGLMDINLPILKFIRENSQILDPQLACTIILNTKDCYFSKPALTWTSTVSKSPKIIPDVIANDSFPPLVFLHLSDFHISMNYEEGSVVDCGFPVCCLKDLGNPSRNGKAGRWGDYFCDVAPSMFTTALKYISENNRNISGIIFTGDIVDHALWNTTKESNIESLRFAYTKLLEYFPNIPIFPVLGNHDSHPTNVYAPFEDENVKSYGLDQQWLYDEIAELWKPWLSPDAIESVQKYGYYAHNYSSELKIIGINSNLCFSYNWWLLYNTSSLQKHLNWLNDELEESELNGQRVYIVGHNSMGNGECIKPWENGYNELIERFSHIIMAQFVGHTHRDEMKIFYDSNQNPINVAWNGASLTTFQYINPNYKTIYVRPDTWEVLDIDTYIFNLSQANLASDQEPNWYKLYSMKSAYNLEDLSPKSYDKLCDRMAKNKTLLNQYWLFYVRYGDPSIETGCGDACQQEILCRITKTQTNKQIKPYCQ